MEPGDWKKDANMASFERYEKLKLKAGEEAIVVFQTEGNFVPASAFEGKKIVDDRGKPIKPRDCIVFEVAHGQERKEWWIGAKNYSVLRALKALSDTNGEKLAGIAATIKRVSDSPTETNYEVTKE